MLLQCNQRIKCSSSTRQQMSLFRDGGRKISVIVKFFDFMGRNVRKICVITNADIFLKLGNTIRRSGQFSSNRSRWLTYFPKGSPRRQACILRKVDLRCYYCFFFFFCSQTKLFIFTFLYLPPSCKKLNRKQISLSVEFAASLRVSSSTLLSSSV